MARSFHYEIAFIISSLHSLSKGIECGPVPQYPRATANTESVDFGTQVSYTCHKGFQTIDRNLVTKTCKTSGSWEPSDMIECQGKL